jgi:HSP20 family protein
MRLVPVRNQASFDDMFNMMDEFFKETRKEMKVGFKLDIIENEGSYVVEGDLPGVKRQDINIDFDNNLLKISVDHHTEENIEEKNYVHRERKQVSMERVLRFKKVNSDAIEAKLENGVLTITLAKLEEIDNKKRIEIQ